MIADEVEVRIDADDPQLRRIYPGFSVSVKDVRASMRFASE
jgi:hypothetical protein